MTTPPFSQANQQTYTEISKSQGIRALDVFVIGPMVIYFGVKAKQEPAWLRALMIGSGVATVYYNARNYTQTKRRVQK